MAASFISTPPTWVVQGQALIYTVQTSSPITSDLRMVITVDWKPVAAQPFVLLGKYYLTLNDAQRVHFNLQDVIDGTSRMEYTNILSGDIHTSTFGSVTTGRPMRDGHRAYRIGCGEFDGSTETLREATHEIQVVQGYVQTSSGFNVDHETNYGTSVVLQKKKFWQVIQSASVANTPITEVPVDPSDTGVVTHMFMPDQSTTSLQPYQLTCVTYNGASVVNTTSVSNPVTVGYPNAASADWMVSGNANVHTSCYPAQVHAFASFTGDWTHMDVQWKNSSAANITGILRFTNVCVRSRSNVTRIAYVNSVGGYNYFTMTGRTRRTLTRRQKTIQKVRGVYTTGIFFMPATEPDYEAFGVEVDVQYTLHAIVPFSQMNELEEVMRSRIHSIQTESGSAFKPVILDTSSLEIRDEPLAQISEVSFDVKLAQKQNV